MSAVAVLVRTARAEWSRLWTVRSTWFLVVAVSLAVVGLGALAGVDTANGIGAFTSAWDAARFTTLFAMFGISALAVVATTSDYTTGGIVPTLQWTPRRGLLLLARSLVVGGTAVALGALLVTGASGMVALQTPGAGLPADEGLRLLGDVAVVVGSSALLSVGLGLLLRSTAGALVSVLALLLVLPLVLGNLPYEAAQTLAADLPGAGAMYLVFGNAPGDSMSDASARAILLGWAGASLVLGGWRLLRTDASR
jgi:hypothetical protein